MFLVHRVDLPKHPGTPVYADCFPVFEYEVKLLWGQLLGTALFYGRSKKPGAAVPVTMKDNFDSCPAGAHVYVTLVPVVVDGSWIRATWSLACTEHVPFSEPNNNPAFGT